MSRVTEATDVVQPGSENDPYRLGWRYVQRTTEEGSVVFDQVPLTPEDVLFPQEEDFIVQDSYHHNDCTYLHGVLSTRYHHDPHTVVLGDCRISWIVPEVKPMGPDIGVIFGVREKNKKWGTFDCATEGTTPSVLFEITSESTRNNDTGIKVDLYYRAQVPWYVVVDRAEPDDHVEIIGYRSGPTGYERLELDERGRLWIEPIGLSLGVEQGHVVLYDGDVPLRGHAQESEARQDAESRAEAAEELARRLQAELDQLRQEKGT